MVWEGIRNREEEEAREIGNSGLMLQGVATSIDALSVGFTMTELGWLKALGESMLIGAVTFAICVAGLRLGRVVGTRLSGRAAVLGGAILIFIGVEIFLKGVL